MGHRKDAVIVNTIVRQALSSAEEACQTADLCVMLVKHDQFCALEEKLQPFHIKLDFCGLLQVSHNQVSQ